MLKALGNEAWKHWDPHLAKATGIGWLTPEDLLTFLVLTKLLQSMEGDKVPVVDPIRMGRPGVCLKVI